MDVWYQPKEMGYHSVTIGRCNSGQLLLSGIDYQTDGSETFDTMISLGFGAVNSNMLLNTQLNSTGTDGLTVSVVFANLPQIILSIVYLSYNALITCMLLANEYSGYEVHRNSPCHNALRPAALDILATITIYLRNPRHSYVCNAALAHLAVALPGPRGPLLEWRFSRGVQHIWCWTKSSTNACHCDTGCMHHRNCDRHGFQKA
jgi:hypothetical protein